MSDIVSTKANIINGKISDIIRARDTTKQDTPSKSKSTLKTKGKLNLSEIPNPIINKCASYLHQKDYANINKVCRQIFIACNTPNSLQRIEFYSEGNKNAHPFNSNLYPNAKHLHFDMSQTEHRMDEIITNSSFLNQLNSLILDGNSGDCDECNKLELEGLSECRNMKTLRLQYFFNGLSMEDHEFEELLSKFPNLDHLELYNVANAKFDFIKDLFPNLKGLALQPTTLTLPNDKLKYEELLYQYIDQLQELEVGDLDLSHLTDIRARKMNCNKLQLLDLDRCSSYTMQCLTRTAKNLRRINIRFLGRMPSFYAVNRSLKCVTDATCDLMKSCPSLESIDLYDTREENMLAAIKGIKKGLSGTRDINRRSMKISMGMRGNEYDPTNLISNVKALVREIKTSKIDDYMFVWRVENNRAPAKLCESLGMDAFVMKGNWESKIIVRKEGSNLY